MRSPRGCRCPWRTPASAPRCRPYGRARAARSASSRPTAADGRHRRRRRAGSCAPPRCGSGCSGGSGRSRTAARSRSRPSRRRCARGRPLRSPGSARRCRCRSASAAGASRGSCAAADGPRRPGLSSTCARGRELAGPGLARRGEPLLLEQHLAQLLGRAEVERPPGELVGLLLELGHAPAEVGREAPSGSARSTLMPCRSMRGEHGDQRPVQRLVDARAPLRREALLEHAVQAQREIGAFRGIGGGALERHLVEADRASAAAADRLVGERLAVEVQLGELGQAVAMARRRRSRRTAASTSS